VGFSIGKGELTMIEPKKRIGASKKLGLIYDVPGSLKSGSAHQRQTLPTKTFPLHAEAEWESEDTLAVLKKSWSELGFELVDLPLNESFFEKWTALSHTLDLVHPLVEGWGSTSREGWIASLAELTGVPFVGSAAAAQNVTLNKHLTKLWARDLGVPVANSILVKSKTQLSHPSLLDMTKQPFFLKPNSEGSGLGISLKNSLSHQMTDPLQQIESLLNEFPEGVLLESLLEGIECTTAVIGEDMQFLPVAQVEVEGGVYGLEWKQKDSRQEKVTFPSLPISEHDQLKTWSITLFQQLDLKDMARIDWKKDAKGKWHLLEINALPGLSPIYSVLPEMALKAGIGFTDLLEKLAVSALSRARHHNLWYGQHLFRDDEF
jgi:D-alanine-D-alanine ligase